MHITARPESLCPRGEWSSFLYCMYAAVEPIHQSFQSPSLQTVLLRSCKVDGSACAPCPFTESSPFPLSVFKGMSRTVSFGKARVRVVSSS